MKKAFICIFISFVFLLTSCSTSTYADDFWSSIQNIIDEYSRPCDHEWDTASCGQTPTCKLCGVDGDTVQHSYQEEITKAPTCTSTGIATFTCSLCQKAYTQILLTQGHDMQCDIISASYEADGYTRHFCSRCTYEYHSDITPRLTYTPEEIYQMCVPATFRVNAYTKNESTYRYGTGFFIDSNGDFVTNYHVIDGCDQIEITLQDGTTYQADYIIISDSQKDLALLSIATEKNDFPYLSLCQSTIAVGESVYTIGNSLGRDFSFTGGMISYADRVDDGVHYIQFDAAISKGNSGGPLLNKYGQVIGINTKYQPAGQNLNFAVHVSELSLLLNDAPYQALKYYILAHQNTTISNLIGVKYSSSEPSIHDAFQAGETELIIALDRTFDSIVFLFTFDDNETIYLSLQETSPIATIVCSKYHSSGYVDLDESFFPHFTNFSGASNEKNYYSIKTSLKLYSMSQLFDSLMGYNNVPTTFSELIFRSSY